MTTDQSPPEPPDFSPNPVIRRLEVSAYHDKLAAWEQAHGMGKAPEQPRAEVVEDA